MAFAPPKNADGSKMQTKMSTWTPLNHQLMNDKVFEERGALLGKWFDKWSDAQRRKILMDLFERCSTPQLRFCSKQLQSRVPSEALDFTTVLPKVLSLYIFSFLDPRSLCRCSQVSWHWKYLTELDQLWMPKCLRFGWYINFSPTPYEQGIWKRHYIEMVMELHVTRPKTPPKDDFEVIDVQPIARCPPEMKQYMSSLPRSPSVSGKTNGVSKRDLPPWRSSDKHPTDTMRYNYLDNYDPIEQARQARKKGGGITPDISQQEHEKKKKQSSASYKLRKAKSLDYTEWRHRDISGGLEALCRDLAYVGGILYRLPPSLESFKRMMSFSMDLSSNRKTSIRPDWASHQPPGYPVNKSTAKALTQSTEWNAGIRPAPVRAPVPKMSNNAKKAYTRMARSSPSLTLFDSQPWQVPASNHGSDDE